jgi:hypothetical protein
MIPSRDLGIFIVAPGTLSYTFLDHSSYFLATRKYSGRVSYLLATRKYVRLKIS